MKKNVVANTFLLSCTYLILWFTDLLSLPYQIVAVYFFVLYILKSAFLLKAGLGHKSFSVKYNFVILIKMISSLLVLSIYFIFFAETASNKEIIRFCSLFVGLYFLYLIVNTKLFFQHTSEAD